MEQQLSFLDAMRAPAIRKPVDPNGPVFQGRVHTVLRLVHPKMAWALAKIEVHPSGELWMWSTEFNPGQGGRGYRVGIKWGKFAHSRADAIYWAIAEIRERLAARCERTKFTPAIERWLNEIEATL